MTQVPVGIAALGLSFPSFYLDVCELARLRGVDPNKYVIGLGCDKMAWCAPQENVVELAVTAAARALQTWPGKLSDIGLIAVGTESAIDMSRPLSAWVAERLGIKGAVRSYEIKHACYGGTLAVRQAMEWKLSGSAQGKAALVIAADIGQYAVNDPGEPTQGAGAVAMIIDEPLIATINPISYAYSEPAFDFWRPIHKSYPLVEGAYSLECYQRATVHCFQQWLSDKTSTYKLDDMTACCFHVPFPKMVKKAVMALGEALNWDVAQSEDFYQRKVDCTMPWNRQTGNSYTASLWTSVAYMLSQLNPGERFSAFSYGSGFGSELLTLTVNDAAKQKAWVANVEKDFAKRQALSAQQYAKMRQEEAEVAA